MEKHKGSVTEYVKDDLKQRQLPESFAPPFDPGYLITCLTLVI